MDASLDGFRAVPWWDGSRVTLSVTGEIDYDTAPCLRAALGRCLLRSPRHIDLDFTGVTFCDASGLNALLWARGRTRATGAVLRVVGTLAPVVALLFHHTDTGDLLAPGGGHDGHPSFDRREDSASLVRPVPLGPGTRDVDGTAR